MYKLMNSVVALALALSSLPLGAELVAYTGATIHPVAGEPIDDGVMLVRDGRIEAVGDRIQLPDGVREERLDGLHLYPGFVHAGTVLGLTEIGSVAGTDDTGEMGKINAAIRARVAVNHDSMLFAPNVAGGVLTAHVTPRGGLVRGTSAAIRLDGWNFRDMTLAAPVGMHIAFPEAAVDNDDDQDLALIEEVLDQARAWSGAMQAHREKGAPRPPANDQLAALAPVVAGDLPVFLHARDRRTMRAALDWAAQQEFGHVVLVGGPDLQHVADRLAADGTPAVLTGVLTMPERGWEPYDEAYAAAARLRETGVQFAIADSGSAFEAGNARNLPFHAGMAAAFGLASEDALKSVTLWPARILGIGDQLGSLEAGKRASFFAASGDPLEPATQIRRVWIDGVEYDLGRDRQRRLYERYRERPRSASAAD